MSEMYNFVIVVTCLLVVQLPNLLEAAPPLKLTIDCESEETDAPLGSLFRPKSSRLEETSSFDVESFCQLIQRAIPQAVKDGKFVLFKAEPDQTGRGDTRTSITVAAPKRIPIREIGLHQLRLPKLKIPKIKVPKLSGSGFGSLRAPRLGRPMSFSVYRDSDEEESSVEKMEKFKKGVRKMLHVVKVLGQVDQYLSERTRIILEKIGKTLAE